MEINMERLVRALRNSKKIVVLMDNKCVADLRDPNARSYKALHTQLQIAAEGRVETYLIIINKIPRVDITFVLELLEGSNLKAILFTDSSQEERAKMTLILKLLMGDIHKVTGSRDYVEERKCL